MTEMTTGRTIQVKSAHGKKLQPKETTIQGINKEGEKGRQYTQLLTLVSTLNYKHPKMSDNYKGRPSQETLSRDDDNPDRQNDTNETDQPNRQLRAASIDQSGRILDVSATNLQHTVPVDPHINVVEPDPITSRNYHPAQQTQEALAADDSLMAAKTVASAPGGSAPRTSRRTPRAQRQAAAVDPNSNVADTQRTRDSKSRDSNNHAGTRPGIVHVQGGGRPANPPRTTGTTPTPASELISDTCVVAHLVPEPDENRDGEEASGEVVIAEQISGKFICGVPIKMFIVLMVLIILIGGNLLVVIVFSPIGINSSNKDTAPTSSPTLSPDSKATTTTSPPSASTEIGPVLQSIKERGFLRCKPILVELVEEKGFTYDLCRAIAAAIFDDPQARMYRLEFPDVQFGQQFAALWNRTIDVSTLTTTYNMERDVYEHSTGQGMAFTTPYFYSGMMFAGRPTFVDCADRHDTLNGECGKLSVCAISGTTTLRLLDDLLPGIEKHEVDDLKMLVEMLANGTCNVIANDSLNLDEDRARQVGYDGEYIIGHKLHSNEPLAVTTKGDDQEWADFCNWILQAIIKAEDLNITQEIALSSSLWSNVESSLDGQFFEASVFGSDHINMFRNIIAAVGNYGEMYDRHYESIIPRDFLSVNTINHGDSGLLYSYPFGRISIDASSSSSSNLPLPGRIAGGTLESIDNRGFLRCGVVGNQTGFALEQHEVQQIETMTEKSIWSGLDIEYCRGIAAAIFQDEVSNVDDSIVFVEVGTVAENGYVALDEDKIDIFVGGSYSLMADLKETTTGNGFTFSPPYYYYDTDTHTNNNNNNNNTNMKGSSSSIGRSLVTKDTDPQWSAFVRWIIIAIIYAEQEGITKEMALEMPVVELFGSDFLQMFRYTILTIGNYDDIFYRTLEQPYNYTRGNMNMINTDGTPQLLPIPHY